MEFSYTMKKGIAGGSAGEIVDIANGFESEIFIEKNGRKAKCKKIMGLMALGIKAGDNVKLTIEGSDESAAADALKNYFDENDL